VRKLAGWEDVDAKIAPTGKDLMTMVYLLHGDTTVSARAQNAAAACRCTLRARAIPNAPAHTVARAHAHPLPAPASRLGSAGAPPHAPTLCPLFPTPGVGDQCRLRRHAGAWIEGGPGQRRRVQGGTTAPWRRCMAGSIVRAAAAPRVPRRRLPAVPLPHFSHTPSNSPPTHPPTHPCNTRNPARRSVACPTRPIRSLPPAARV
jgi:hypothetical protein